MDVKVSDYGKTAAGEPVEAYRLQNGLGTSATVITYGAILVRLELPDRNGRVDNVVLCYDSLAGYETGSSYFGATVGRYGNRIAMGRFSLGDTEVTLATNDGPNHLHGGKIGFDRRIWKAEILQDEHSVGVRFHYTSPDGEEGYPGTVQAAVTYRLTVGNELRIDYKAKTDKPTPINLTHHSYFNLAGHASGDVMGHELTLHCDDYLPVDAALIPSGEILPVRGTLFDFTSPKKIGTDIGKEEGLYDHCFVCRRHDPGVTWIAEVTEPLSGRRMAIGTTEPGVQFYTANHLKDERGADGAIYQARQGFCLETQHFPDSPNQSKFPSTVLRPGEVYRSSTIHKFSVLPP